MLRGVVLVRAGAEGHLPLERGGLPRPSPGMRPVPRPSPLLLNDHSGHWWHSPPLPQAAIRDENPVVFLENELVYGEAFPIDDACLKPARALFSLFRCRIGIGCECVSVGFAVPASCSPRWMNNLLILFPHTISNTAGSPLWKRLPPTTLFLVVFCFRWRCSRHPLITVHFVVIYEF